MGSTSGLHFQYLAVVVKIGTNWRLVCRWMCMPICFCSLANGRLLTAAEPKRKQSKPSAPKFEKKSDTPKPENQASIEAVPGQSGSYLKRLRAAIGSVWYHEVNMAKDRMMPGSVVVAFSVSSDGKRTIRSVQGTPENADNEKVARNAVEKAEIIVPTAEVFAELEANGIQKFTFNFNVPGDGFAELARSKMSRELAAAARGDLPPALLNGTPTEYELMGQELPSYVKAHLVKVHAEVARAWNYHVRKRADKIGHGAVVIVFQILEDGAIKEETIKAFEKAKEVENDLAIEAARYSLKDAATVELPDRVTTWIKVHGLRYRVRFPIERR